MDRASRLNVLVSMVAALCLGCVGGAAHRRMSLASLAGADVARCMGLGSAAAVVLQYLLQFQWGVTPFLPVSMLAAFALLLSLLLCEYPEAATEGDGKPERTPPGRIAASVLIASIHVFIYGAENSLAYAYCQTHDNCEFVKDTQS